MTPDDVKSRVAAIEAESGDNETAHCDEDALYQAVLLAIAEGAAEPRELAREALKTSELTFTRWYA
jgi:hypothetical protein